MDIILVIVGFLALVIGLIGSVVPALPGPPVSLIGLLLIHYAGYGNFHILFLVILGAITILIMVLDNILPAWMTKRFGGSRMAVIGSVIGLAAGMIFFAPAGILAGPFLGALAGELINSGLQSKRAAKAAGAAKPQDKNVESVQSESDNNQTNSSLDESASRADAGNVKKANPLKAAFGAFLAFIVGTGAKLIIAGVMIYFAFKAVFGS